MSKTKKKKAIPTVEDLIEQANNALNKFQPELAAKFYKRAIEMSPNETNLMDAYADVLLQLGEVKEAYELLQKSCTLAPLTNPFKWLFLAQLQQGHDSLSTYRKAIEILTNNLDSEMDEIKIQEIRKQITKAYCSISELYLTDLCFDDNAETICEESVKTALAMDEDSIDAFQTLASIRLSQNRQQDACIYINKVFDRIMLIREEIHARSVIKEIQGEDLQVYDDSPELEFCIATCKLLIECGTVQPTLNENALDLITDLLQDDDENIELWYIAGVASLGLHPADKESARYHFERAKEMMEKLKEHCREANEDFPFCEQYELLLEHLSIIESGTEIINQQSNIKDNSEDILELENEEEWSTCDEDENDATNDKL